MVDAAIGGKTGVNLPEGKNLVGAFWQPSGRAVRHRPALSTLPIPASCTAAGLGELAKYHFIGQEYLGGRSLDDMTLPDERMAASVSRSRPTSWRPTSVRAAGGPS